MEMQEQIIRRVTLIGNGAHIFTPKEWLNEKVLVVRLEKKSINEKVLEIVSPYLDKVICILLYGSYARNENTEESDIDVLVISREKFKIDKTSDVDFLIVPEESLNSAIKINPLLMYSIFKEAKPIINGKYFEELKKIELNKKLFFPFLKSTKESIKSSQKIIELDKKIGEFASNSVVYSLILRLRGAFIIENIFNKKKYSNKLFKKWLKENCKVDPEKLYKIYQIVRSGKKEKDIALISEEESLIDFLKEEIKKLESLLKRNGE